MEYFAVIQNKVDVQTKSNYCMLRGGNMIKHKYTVDPLLHRSTYTPIFLSKYVLLSYMIMVRPWQWDCRQGQLTVELEHLWILVSEWVLEPIVHGNGGNDCKYREIEIEKKLIITLVLNSSIATIFDSVYVISYCSQNIYKYIHTYIYFIIILFDILLR